MRIALITGASSGMGELFAVDIDRDEKDIDEIWLIARREERLKEVAAKLNHPAKVVPMDLLPDENVEELEKMLDEEKAQVGIFINCAGYGKIGDYEHVSSMDSKRMIDLNCRVAVSTTLAVIPHMRAGDRIVELCSASSFFPVTHLNIYAAGKAFLYSYTRSLRMELLHTGIVVTAVCPYWVGDTEFLKVAKDNEANSDVGQSIHRFIFPTKKENVVRTALRASRNGRAVCTPGFMAVLDRFFSKLIPTTGMVYIWEVLRRV